MTKSQSTVRTRFAPSPTGYMHVGGVRTALFAWLVARQAGGSFILRLEDTDQTRRRQGAEAHIIDSLQALGITVDEGVGTGGRHAPYRQSERLDVYQQWADKLIRQGRAYADPYTPERIEAFRHQAKQEKRAFLYRHHRPDTPAAWDGSQPLRFKSEPKSYDWHDEVMGDLHAGPEAIDDFILIKSDGYPTYNFAHIVDDAEMAVSHVIRGQEFIASVPNYLNLYEALGIKPPAMATMPHILGPDGKKKLSKRDGAKDVLDYARDGFLPEALVNFIASLGWNDGTEQEIFTRDELVQKFSLDHVQTSSARFDEQRLMWMNGQHIRQLSLDELESRIANSKFRNFWPEAAKNESHDYRKKVLALAQDRLKTLADLPTLTSFFFAEPTPDWSMVDNNKQLKKHSRDELASLLRTVYEKFERTEFNETDLIEALNELLAETGHKPAVLFGLVRFALTWAPFSPGLAETMAVLGKNATLTRVQAALDSAT